MFTALYDFTSLVAFVIHIFDITLSRYIYINVISFKMFFSFFFEIKNSFTKKDRNNDFLNYFQHSTVVYASYRDSVRNNYPLLCSQIRSIPIAQRAYYVQ